MTVRVTTLPSGLRIATDSMDTVETVSLGAWVAVGARHESDALGGVSHFLEHMAFKGTEGRTAKEIVEEIEAVGGHLNAYTGRENTAYFAKVLAEDAPLALDIIADILQYPIFDVSELERERQVILQEIHQANDTPDDIVFDHFQAAAFPGQAIGRPVLGEAATIAGMGRDAIIAYMKGEYSAPRIVIAAAGRIDHDDFAGRVAAAFTELPENGGAAPQPISYRGGEHRELRDLEQVQLVLGFAGVSHTDDGYYPLSVLSTLAGGGMSSRLFQEIREARGLVYSIYSFTSAYQDGGLFGVYAGTGSDQVAELVPVALAELKRLADGAPEAEIARARAQLKASTLMSLESTSARAEAAARQLQVYGRTIPTEEVIEKIDAVTEKDLIAAAERLLESPLTVAALGPAGRLAEYGELTELVA